MTVSRRALCAAVTALGLARAALAQTPARTIFRGVVDGLDGRELRLTTRRGDNVTLRLAETPRVAIVVPISIDAIKPGSFIGTSAVAQPDGTLKALEVHVFPEAMRGTGEGHRPWDLAPGSTMTNGTVGELKVSVGF